MCYVGGCVFQCDWLGVSEDYVDPALSDRFTAVFILIKYDLMVK